MLVLCNMQKKCFTHIQKSVCKDFLTKLFLFTTEPDKHFSAALVLNHSTNDSKIRLNVKINIDRSNIKHIRSKAVMLIP